MLNRTIAIIGVLAAGCTSMSVTLLNPPPRKMHSRPPASVMIFSSGPPQRPHLDVLYLEARQETALSPDGTRGLIAALRERAGSAGCDALVLGGVTHASDPISDRSSTKGITATCIVYLPEAPEVTPRPATPAAVPARPAAAPAPTAASPMP